MKSSVVICVLFCVGLAMARPGDDHYPARYDDVDLVETLDNGKLYIAYLNCLLGLGKCTAEGNELKSHIKEALENECAKCTKKQKEGVKYVFKRLINEKKEDWNLLTAKYDPENKYRTMYEDQLREVKA